MAQESVGTLVESREEARARRRKKRIIKYTRSFLKDVQDEARKLTEEQFRRIQSQHELYSEQRKAVEELIETYRRRVGGVRNKDLRYAFILTRAIRYLKQKKEKLRYSAFV